MRNNKTKIVVDTNVFINSMIFPKKHKKDLKAMKILFDLVEIDKVELVFSQDTIGELIYNMKNKILHNIKEMDEQIIAINTIADIFLYSYSVNTSSTITEKCKDPRDDMFIECGVKGRANYIMTNDYESGMFAITQYDLKVLNCDEFIEIFGDKDEVALD